MSNSERFSEELLSYAVLAGASANLFANVQIGGISDLSVTVTNVGPGEITVYFKRSTSPGIAPIELTALTKSLAVGAATEVVFNGNCGELFTLSVTETKGSNTTVNAAIRGMV